MLTGAGVSAESGIPTFRGEGSLWRNYNVFDLATPGEFLKDPSLVWQFYHYRREVVDKCKPNPAHYAITKFEKLCNQNKINFTLITQNIDGFHTLAGTKNVIEMHGNLWNVKPFDEPNFILEKDKVWEDRNVPICESLGNNICRPDLDKNKGYIKIPDSKLPHKNGKLLRPAVVWFGESLDEKVTEKYLKALENCDLLIVCGTSAVVYPAAGFVYRVNNNKNESNVVEFNLETTNNSKYCTYSFKGKAGKLLPKAFDIKF